jgi:hypothetical protein
MGFIRTNNDFLNVNQIARYKKDAREVPQEQLTGHGLQRVTRLPSKSETVLRLTLNDGRSETLYGRDAEEALAILEAS